MKEGKEMEWGMKEGQKGKGKEYGGILRKKKKLCKKK